MTFKFRLNPFGTVKKIINEWEPRRCSTEKDFEKSLLLELQNKLKDEKILSQYGSGRQRVDIVVHGKVPIEIKKDLRSNAALQRTIGQLEQYLEDWGYLFLVLCGNVNSELLKSLKEYVNKKTDIVGDDRIDLIVK